LQYTPYLRHFDVEFADFTGDTPVSFTIPSMITLKISVIEPLFALTDLLKNMPNLRHLTVKTDDINMNGYQWEQILRHSPNLKVFRLHMTFYLQDNDNKEQHVDELLKSFRTQFWIEEHRWFIRCDWDRCQESSCNNQIYLYTLPYTFKDYYFHDSTIKEKSTCPDIDIYSSYKQVYTLEYEIVPSENRVSSQFTFTNIHDLDLYLPVDDNFWQIMSGFDYLNSIKVAPYEPDHDLDSQFQLQIILDRAPHLYSLGFARWSSTSMEMPPFEYSSKSVRRLDLQDVDRFYNTQQCIKLSHSSLGMQCEVVSIVVENRTNIIDLLTTMPNLRALNVISRDDSWTNENNNRSSADDELIIWLQHCLPSTYTITRNSDGISDNRFLNSFYSVRLWIG
jgi:hypothetical protein